MEKVIERPALPTPSGAALGALATWATSASLLIASALGAIGYRLNRSLPADGTEAMTGPLVLMTYTVATRPAAASYTRALIYVSDAAAGNKLQYSDGASWIAAG